MHSRIGIQKKRMSFDIVPVIPATGGCGKKLYQENSWCLIDHSSTANGMHGFKMTRSSDAEVQIIHAPLFNSRRRSIVEITAFSI